jgi:hypothetical protein
MDIICDVTPDDTCHAFFFEAMLFGLAEKASSETTSFRCGKSYAAKHFPNSDPVVMGLVSPLWAQVGNSVLPGRDQQSIARVIR